MIKNKLTAIFFLVNIVLFAQKSVNTTCFQSIQDFGAVMDGETDDSRAIVSSLEQLGYAYIPKTDKGIAISKEIELVNGQKVFGAGRSSKIVSNVPNGRAAFKISSVPFSGDAIIENLSLEIGTLSVAIHILESRGAFIDNIFINGKKKCTVGILIDGGSKLGSAWNQISRYTILHCKVGIHLTSSTKRNWCNRNFIGFGVVQSCDTAVKLERANTNKIEANPQGCGLAFQIINSHHNRIESFTENSDTFDINVDKPSRQNTFVGEFSPSKILDLGKDNLFSLSRKRTKMYYDRVEGKN